MPPQAALGAEQPELAKIVSMTAIPEEDDSMVMKETLESSANRLSM